MHPRITDWLRSAGRAPFDFQREAWQAYLSGESGLVHAPTGTGKTFAVWLGPVIEWLSEYDASDGHGRQSLPVPPMPGSPMPPMPPARRSRIRRGRAEPNRVLWITPLRALAGDTTAALRESVEALGLPWSVELRTGDTSAHAKRRQIERLPTALVTTPESLSLLLTHQSAQESLASLRAVVVDEWHELMGTKRGVQTELCLARLRLLAPALKTWGLSATLGNLDEALETLLGRAGAAEGRIIAGNIDKRVEIETLIPDDIERFPWSGHLGSRLLPAVINAVERARSTLLFTNTRSQTELWFQSILRARPDWIGAVALHHGSLDRALRERVEAMLASGALRCVVCTSSLDLGVDFTPVDQVIQVGSPKGVARLIQRAGRSGHQPGAVSRAIGVPTHAFELVEFAAARAAIARGDLESRTPLSRPLDVLVQHLVTLALGGGFAPHEALAEVRSTRAYRDLTDEEWGWALDFIARGGPALTAYPQFARVVEKEGRLVGASPALARLHRMSVGTITGDGAVAVRFRNGATLGTVEESFAARLRAGDRFTFAGRTLELIQVHDMTALVRPARSRGTVPRWGGAKMPFSTKLASSVLDTLREAREGRFDGPEMTAVRPVLEVQARWSRIPAPGDLLIEQTDTRDGFHTVIFPFAGRLAHEGLAAIAAHRLTRGRPLTVSFAMNDYGFALITPEPVELDEPAWRAVFTTERLIEDMLACVNTVALARRAFRGVARVAGLVFQGFPGAAKTARQLQASSELFFDVFTEHDPSNLLLGQAQREVLERELEVERIRAALRRIEQSAISIIRTDSLTPMAFPLWAEFIQASVSSEAWSVRVRKMAVVLEAASAAGGGERAEAPLVRPEARPSRRGGPMRARRSRGRDAAHRLAR